ncbi:MAG TPA: hypothetical protein VGM60_17640, partial [Pseudonocardia sp.]|uniref:COG4705 family protein n=1 Tax=Pseudonocardia sp. TaxID=60912 RepID=UPI002F3F11A5
PMSTAEYHHDARLGRPAQLANKMPQITAVFWITKILTTGMGESASDYFTHVLGRGLAISLGGAGLAAALVLQFSFRRYVVWAYWLAIVMVSVFGTMAADGLHRLLGVPFWASTAFYALALAVIFVAWYSIEKTLSIHTIYTRRRETFYWATVLATFALGTAAGDWTATTLRIGYLASGIMFAVIFALPAVAHWRFGLNATLAFWFAYVITRPFGASFADWFAASPKRHGLGMGTGPVTLVSTIIIAGFVGYLAITHKATGDDDVTALGRTPVAVGDAELRDDN